MLDAATLDAITVATDHKHHFAPAMAALKRGVNVIIEKPITTSLEEAYTLLETAKARGVKLGGVFQRRFFPAALRMHKAIEEGRIGRVAVAECVALLGRDRAYFARDAWRGTWKGEGGGALMNQAIHMIDMLLWMVGVPTEVYGRWATLKHGDYIDVEDFVLRRGELRQRSARDHHRDHDAGIRSRRRPASASRCTARPDIRSGLSGDPRADSRRSPINGRSIRRRRSSAWAAAEGGKPGFPAFHSDQLRDFAHAISRTASRLVTGLQAYRALEVIKAVYLSEARRQPISLPMSAADRTEADRITGGRPT